MALSLKGSFQKLTWQQVREDVIKVNPGFAGIIDKLSPSNKYWLAKVVYPYGSLILKRALLMLPNSHGQFVPITDSSIPSEIREELGYNMNSNPVSLVLKNCFEIFLPLEDRTIPIPLSLSGLIYPGTAFGAWRVLNPEKSQHPIFIWDMAAGARSVFMLPKITEVKKHMRLKKAFNLTANVPRSLMDHWEVFKQLANSTTQKETWNAEILFFSQHWFNQLNDSNWQDFYQYFRNSGWGSSELWRNQAIWNLVLSLILKDYEGRPSGYVIDTAKYLLYMGAGSFPGFAPAQNNLAGPFEAIQEIYENIYELKNYPPIIMQPDLFDMYSDNDHAVYYSLQFPNALEFKPKSRIRNSIISDLHEIRSLMIRYEQGLLSDKFNIAGTSLSDLFKYTQYDYFHTGLDLHIGMCNSVEMPIKDKTLLTTINGKKFDRFPDTCSFAKGCIRVSHKNTLT